MKHDGIGTEINTLEQTGEKFNLETFLEARQICMSVTRNILSQVWLGMSERDGQGLIKSEFLKVGVNRFWHPSKFRIGTETIKSFRELPDEGVTLKDRDVFFIDVGPIIQDHEADYGETQVFLDTKATQSDPLQSDYEKLASAAKEVWLKTANAWRTDRLTGVDLLNVAQASAQNLGYELNPSMAGHRLGDFPHALFSKAKLFELNQKLSSHLWVLEIHITEPKLKLGAFFEDLLIENTDSPLQA